jgi:hypothetical protein
MRRRPYLEHLLKCAALWNEDGEEDFDRAIVGDKDALSRRIRTSVLHRRVLCKRHVV